MLIEYLSYDLFVSWGWKYWGNEKEENYVSTNCRCIQVMYTSISNKINWQITKWILKSFLRLWGSHVNEQKPTGSNFESKKQASQCKYFSETRKMHPLATGILLLQATSAHDCHHWTAFALLLSIRSLLWHSYAQDSQE